jgi:hypothetical protein
MFADCVIFLSSSSLLDTCKYVTTEPRRSERQVSFATEIVLVSPRKSKQTYKTNAQLTTERRKATRRYTTPSISITSTSSNSCCRYVLLIIVVVHYASSRICVTNHHRPIDGNNGEPNTRTDIAHDTLTQTQTQNTNTRNTNTKGGRRSRRADGAGPDAARRRLAVLARFCFGWVCSDWS